MRDVRRQCFRASKAECPAGSISWLGNDLIHAICRRATRSASHALKKLVEPRAAQAA